MITLWNPAGCFRSAFAVCWIALVCAGSASAEEEQAQGVHFEQRVIDQLMGRGHTSEWDIPADANLKSPGIPGSIKFIQAGNSIYMGDARRQRAITEPFEIVVGFYGPDRKGKKAKIRSVHVIRVDPVQWAALWGSVTLAELEAFDRDIKGIPLEDAQALGRSRAAQLTAKAAGMKINPKINKDQRRIQCSLDYAFFCQAFLGDPSPPAQLAPSLWGKPFPKELPLGLRASE